MYLKKGSKAGIVGRLQIDKVEDKYFTKVVVEEVEFAGDKKDTKDEEIDFSSIDEDIIFKE